MSYQVLKVSGTLVERWEYQYAPILFTHRERKDKSRTGNRKNFTRRADNVRRAKTTFTRLVRSNLVADQSPALVTLTLLQVVSVKTSFRLLTEFVSRLRKHYGKEFRYIGVIEFQDRGATHFHMLFWGLPGELVCTGRFIRRGKKKVFYCDSWKNGQCECEKRRIQNLWARGYVDCIATDGSPKLAGYLAKYMSKAMYDTRLGGERSYCASRNVLRSMRATSTAFSDEVLREVGVTDTPTHVHKFPVRFLGECTYTAFTRTEKTEHQDTFDKVFFKRNLKIPTDL